MTHGKCDPRTSRMPKTGSHTVHGPDKYAHAKTIRSLLSPNPQDGQRRAGRCEVVSPPPAR
eukprot:6654463-Alexandrium_andersonii.AAC.1